MLPSALALGGAIAIAARQYFRRASTYPYTYRSATYDSYASESGKKVLVPTPYEWLEDPHSEETKAWVNKQNQVTEKYLQQNNTTRQKFQEQLLSLNDFPKSSCPYRRGASIFHFHNTGLQNHSVLYRSAVDGSAAADKQELSEVILNPNEWAADGTIALATSSISENASYIAYARSKSGSDWSTIYVKDLTSNKDLPDQLEWVRFSGISWTKDEKGFFYSRYPAPSADTSKQGEDTAAASSQALYYHRLGTSQEQDVLIFQDSKNPTHMFGGQVSDDGKFLIITVSEGCDPVNKLWLLDLTTCTLTESQESPAAKIVKLIDNFDAEYDYITNDQSLFYFKTNLKAPRYKVICMDVASPEGASSFREILPQHSCHVLEYSVCVAQNKLLACYLQDVKHTLSMYQLETGEFKSDIMLPCPGTVSGLGYRRKDSTFYFSFTSFVHAGIILKYDVDAQQLCIHKEIRLEKLPSDLFVVKQVFYPSKDGTKIPMFIIHRRDLVLDGSNPTMLYGYGGFNISLMPSFSVSRLLWVQQFNGVYCVANLRGGGEYGEEWHKAGSLLQKQNVFDDFQAAARYLVAEKYTRADKIAINGGSNGGLLVAACINQAPELFGAAVAQVGVMDMLKFHKFTIGYAWKSDYGCAEDPSYFDYLMKYSPVHNIAPNKVYPSVLLTTADHDDRVVPSHSYKYIAELQHQRGQDPAQVNPLLIRIETKAGHGAGKPLAKLIEDTAVMYSFVAHALKAEWRGDAGSSASSSAASSSFSA